MPGGLKQKEDPDLQHCSKYYIFFIQEEAADIESERGRLTQDNRGYGGTGQRRPLDIYFRFILAEERLRVEKIEKISGAGKEKNKK